MNVFWAISYWPYPVTAELPYQFVKIGILDGMFSRPPQTLHGIMWMASSLLNLTFYQYRIWLHLGK